MIDPPAIPDRDALVQRTARTMWLAFIVAACGFIALAHFRLKPQAQPVPDPTVTYVLTAVAAVDLVIFAVLRNIRLRNSREQRTRGDAVLAVEAQQVIPIEAGTADGRLMVKAGMGSVPVVVMQP